VTAITSTAANWRRVLGQRIRRLSPAQAVAILEAHRRRGAHIGDPAYRDLTGGFSSQAIDAVVSRRLGEQAGLVRKL